MTGNIKVAVLGGGGVRTPLLIHGLVEAQPSLGIAELALYDIDHRRAALMQSIGNEIGRDSGVRITTPPGIKAAVEGAHFVLSSLRVGGMAARARDERVVIEQGLAGQETTGPGGLAMALRTVPVALEQAAIIERHAPTAWLINFTNPAGLITQALTTHSSVRVVGICDTPSELFHRIAWALGEPFEEVDCQYFGLNHLGWVRRVLARGEDVTGRLLDDEAVLSRLYPGNLFDPAMLRSLSLIPTEYLFFCYSQLRAYLNQKQSGASRGEEILQLNASLIQSLESETEAGRPSQAIEIYKDYLNQRNSSYFRLEANAESALDAELHGVKRDWNPFEGATGYHRIAIEVMKALASGDPARIVVNVRNDGTIADLADADIVEAPCLVDRRGPKPLPADPLPEEVRGLVLAVKAYERIAIRAAVEKSFDLARLALLVYPIVGQWEIASQVLKALVESDPEHLGYLR